MTRRSGMVCGGLILAALFLAQPVALGAEEQPEPAGAAEAGGALALPKPGGSFDEKLLMKLRRDERRRDLAEDEAAYLAASRLPMVMAHYTSEVYGGAKMPYLVYLPPSYEKETARRYPVIYFLHGRTGSPDTGIIHGKNIDAGIREGKCPEMIVVACQGKPNGMYTDSPTKKDFKDTSSILKDFVPHIDATYRTIAAREGRMLEGRSMGGFGAGHIGFMHPELFGAVSMFSAAMLTREELTSGRFESIFDRAFGGDIEFAMAQYPGALVKANADKIRGTMHIRVYAGTLDPLCKVNAEFHALLEELKIEHEYEEVPKAGHGMPQVWDRSKDPFAFYRRVWGDLEGAGAAVVPAPTIRK